MSDSECGGGVSILGLLGVLFVGLKLGNVIDWSWWWVTLPFWIFPALVAAGFIAGLAGALIWAAATTWRR